jgi:hypothetical protein
MMSKFHRNKKKDADPKDKRLIIILVIAGVFMIAFLDSL